MVACHIKSGEAVFHLVHAIAQTVRPSDEGRPQAIGADCSSCNPHHESPDVATKGTTGEWLAIGVQKERASSG